MIAKDLIFFRNIRHLRLHIGIEFELNRIAQITSAQDNVKISTSRKVHILGKVKIQGIDKEFAVEIFLLHLIAYRPESMGKVAFGRKSTHNPSLTTAKKKL